jgi:ferric-dicitrate binding protein FerR (iron transport regulator)
LGQVAGSGTPRRLPDIRQSQQQFADQDRQALPSTDQQIPAPKQAWNKLFASWKRLEEGQKEDLRNYKDVAVFDKAKMDLQGGGRSRR